VGRGNAPLLFARGLARAGNSKAFAALVVILLFGRDPLKQKLTATRSTSSPSSSTRTLDQHATPAMAQATQPIQRARPMVGGVGQLH
jgi:hypothetical protein